MVPQKKKNTWKGGLFMQRIGHVFTIFFIENTIKIFLYNFILLVTFRTNITLFESVMFYLSRL